MPPSKTQPALLGGLVIGVLSALPVINLANCCCAWILFGGGLAAYLMQQNQDAPISVGDGAVAGLLAGAVGSLVWVVLAVPINAMMAPVQAGLLQRVLANSGDLPPEMRGLFERMSSGPIVGVRIVFGFVVMLMVSTVFGLLGGLFGALFFRKAAPAPPPPIPEA